MEAILIAVMLALCIRTFVVQAFKIPSGSMKETLQIGDHILVSKFAYGLEIPFLKIPLYAGRQPGRGDVIVFKYPEDPEKDFIKRVVAVGGDVVEIRNKQVYVNQKEQNGDFIIHMDPVTRPTRRDEMRPVQVPENKFFVMGDNRDNSHDSRFWGFVDRQAILGQAFFIYWSWDSQATSLLGHVRWERLADKVK